MDKTEETYQTGHHFSSCSFLRTAHVTRRTVSVPDGENDKKPTHDAARVKVYSTKG